MEYLQLTDIVLPRTFVESVTRLKNPDVALLYLAIAKDNGQIGSIEEMGESLGWKQDRLYAAVRELVDMRILLPEVLNDEAFRIHHRDYSQREIVSKMKENRALSGLIAEMEKMLKKHLSTQDKNVILELNDANQMPTDVIFLLFYHCYKMAEMRKLNFSMKTFAQIGFKWVSDGVLSQTAAEERIGMEIKRLDTISRLMFALGQGDRVPTVTEEKYLNAWMDMGFTIDAVLLAYDKTIMKCGSFRWAYCDGIIRRWNGAGMHTTAEIKSIPNPETFYAEIF